MAQLKTVLKRSVLFLTVMLVGGAIYSAPAHALDRRVVIRNQTTQAVVTMQASNVGTTRWEEDMLGDSILLPGHSVVADIDDGSGYCKFDLRFTFTGGGEVVKPNVNVCEITVFTLVE